MIFKTLSFVMLFCIVPSANAQCLLCAVGGYMVGSSASSSSTSKDKPALRNGDIIYSLPMAGERVLNPMGVRMGSVYLNFGSPRAGSGGYGAKGETLWELFKMVEPAAHEYQILEIRRVLGPNSWATIWFTYVEKKDVRPLNPPTAEKLIPDRSSKK